MTDFTLILAARSLPEIFRIFREAKLFGGKPNPDDLPEITLDQKSEKGLKLTLANPQSDHPNFWPLIYVPIAMLVKRPIGTICIPSQNGDAILIPMKVPERSAGILETGQTLRISFCGSALYRWHHRSRPDLTGPWYNGDNFGVTIWEHTHINATPAMSQLRLFSTIQTEELATLMPLHV